MITANPALCRMYGRSLDEVVGQTSALVVQPDEREEAAQSIAEVIAGRIDHYTAEKYRRIAPTYSEKTYLLEANSLNLKTLRLDFDDSAEARLQLTFTKVGNCKAPKTKAGLEISGGINDRTNR